MHARVCRVYLDRQGRHILSVAWHMRKTLFASFFCVGAMFWVLSFEPSKRIDGERDICLAAFASFFLQGARGAVSWVYLVCSQRAVHVCESKGYRFLPWAQSLQVLLLSWKSSMITAAYDMSLSSFESTGRKSRQRVFKIHNLFRQLCKSCFPPSSIISKTPATKRHTPWVSKILFCPYRELYIYSKIKGSKLA